MCGRFTLTVHQFEDVVASLDALIERKLLESYRPRYNIAPGNQHWVLCSGESGREMIPARFGLIPRWAKDPAIGYKMINARGETLAERPAYRDAFKKRRCIVPADGFYEWTGPKHRRRPIWFHAPDDSLLLMAGLYENWFEPNSDEPRTTFTIITTDAGPPVSEIHHRMPALLQPAELDSWLLGPPSGDLLRPAPPGTLVSQRASRRVNSPANDDPQCLEADEEDAEPPPTPPTGQLSLL